MSDDYELVRLDGAAPDEWLGELVDLFEAINDAPTDAMEVEPDSFPVERIRRYESAMAHRRQHLYRLMARHKETGAWAGHTIVCVDEHCPGFAMQEDTSVVSAHRGHRLGMLLKATMLLWLRDAQPDARDHRHLERAVQPAHDRGQRRARLRRRGARGRTSAPPLSVVAEPAASLVTVDRPCPARPPCPEPAPPSPHSPRSSPPCSCSRRAAPEVPTRWRRTPPADQPVRRDRPRPLTKSTPTHEPAPPPKAGTCRQLSFGAIGRYSNQTATVDCSKPHTALTFAVEQLPKDVAFDGVDVGNDAVQEKASLQCRTAFAKYIGGSAATRALSRLSVTYFVPTQQDFDAGSRWVRCDVIALQSARILASLPETVKGFNDTDAGARRLRRLLAR